MTETVEGSELYQRQIASRENNNLMRKVWNPTPWMLNVYTGSISDDDGRRGKIIRWCCDHFGKESWPIHDMPADWYFGSATIDGWTWMGFATEAMMLEFLEVWGGEDDD